MERPDCGALSERNGGNRFCRAEGADYIRQGRGHSEGQGHCRSGGGTHAEAGGRGGRTLRGRRASPHACEYALSEPSGYGAAEGDR